MVELGAQPVENRHEVVDHNLDAVLGQVFQGLAVVLDVLIASGLTELDVFVNVDRLDNFDFQACGVDFINELLDFFFGPDLAHGDPVHCAHESGGSGDLLDVLEGNWISLAAVPAECHFHRANSLLSSSRTAPGPAII